MMFQNDVVLCVDPSINTAGYSVYSREKLPRVKNEYEWHLSAFGCLKSNSDESSYQKIVEISCLVKQIAETKMVTHAIIEIPAEVIYLDDIMQMPKERQRSTIMARASRVMKLFSSGNYYLGMLSAIGVNTRPILPVSWQTHKTKRKGRDTKSWSIDHANAFLKSEGSVRILSSGAGENTADAINIGFMVLNAGKAGGFDGKS